MCFNTPIEVTEDTGSSQAEAKRCGTKVARQGSTVAKTLSTTETVDTDEILQEALKIRRKRKEAYKQSENVITGYLKQKTFKFLREACHLKMFILCTESLLLVVDPVIKFEVNPTPEQIVTAESNNATGGAAIVLDQSDKSQLTSKKGKSANKKRRHEDADVVILEEGGPNVRFPNFLNIPLQIENSMTDLRMHVLVAQVNYYNSVTRFYDKASSLIPHVKRLIADGLVGKTTASSKQQNDSSKQ